jgi:hypothetical protein
MKSTEFCYWLQGYFELRRGEAQSGMSLTHEQVEIIERHLALVFKHEIDPSYGPPSHQNQLNQIHGGELMRC